MCEDRLLKVDPYIIQCLSLCFFLIVIAKHNLIGNWRRVNSTGYSSGSDGYSGIREISLDKRGQTWLVRNIVQWFLDWKQAGKLRPSFYAPVSRGTLGCSDNQAAGAFIPWSLTGELKSASEVLVILTKCQTIHDHLNKLEYTKIGFWVCFFHNVRSFSILNPPRLYTIIQNNLSHVRIERTFFILPKSMWDKSF